MKKIPVIPDCYKDLPDNTLMNSRDVAKMFNYKSYKGLHVSVKDGCIPSPDIKRGTDSRNGSIVLKFWKLGTIRKWKNDNSI